MEQQDLTLTLVLLPGNVLQDIGSRLDGHSLLALLRTCREMSSNDALRACLFEAVLRTLATLQTALQNVLQAGDVAQAMLKAGEAIYYGVTNPGEETRSTLLYPFVLRLGSALAAHGRLLLMRKDEHSLNRARMGVLEQQEDGVWGALGPIVEDAGRRAAEMLSRAEVFGNQPPATAFREDPVREREIVQAVLSGQPQAGDSLQLLVEGWAQLMKQQARVPVQELVQGVQRLAGQSGNSVLQAAVQAAQELMQDSAGP